MENAQSKEIGDRSARDRRLAHFFLLAALIVALLAGIAAGLWSLGQ
jgi:hypothetical protein